MNTQRLLIGLTVANAVLLVVSLAERWPAVAADGTLRGRALELVDDRGRVRASLQILPASRQPNGDLSAETVLLRLITEKGRPAVKIGASEEGAGLSLAGPTGTTDTYIVLDAHKTTSSMTLKSEDGRTKIVKPAD